MSINAADILTRILPKLNAAATGDLVFWTSDEIYRYIDEAQERIARVGVRAVKVDSNQTTSVVTLPADLATLTAVFFNGIFLRPSNVGELEALDDNWQNTVAVTPTRWLADDNQGLVSLRVYPAPVATSWTLSLIYYQVPQPVISSSNTTSPINRALDSYLLLRAVEAARMKESKGGMPEVAQAIAPMAAQYESAAIALWK